MTSIVGRRWTSSLLALSCLACPGSCRQRDQGVGAQQPGVKISLPPGWLAHPAGESSLRVGPPGRPVLRIDRRPGEEQLPDLSELEKEIEREYGVQVKAGDVQRAQDHVLAILQLELGPGDGGAPTRSSVLLGAKRVRSDLFLCATLPGSSEEEVKRAAEACRSVTR